MVRKSRPPKNSTRRGDGDAQGPDRHTDTQPLLTIDDEPYMDEEDRVCLVSLSCFLSIASFAFLPFVVLCFPLSFFFFCVPDHARSSVQ